MTVSLYGGDPCPDCGAELEYEEYGEPWSDVDIMLWCPNRALTAQHDQGGPPPATPCQWIANGYPATNGATRP